MPKAITRLGWRVAGLVAAAVVVLPLFGVWLAGGAVEPLFAFPPPLAIPSEYPRFSWTASGLVLAAGVAVVVAVVRGNRQKVLTAPARIDQAAGEERQMVKTADCPGAAFPLWGWVALGWTALCWLVAWSRFDGFEWGQRYTFFPLWLGFVVAVNAFAWRRHHTCLMTRAPGRWLTLFGASALFWWGFEWLNRFVRNWHYLGVQDFEAIGYAVHATLCFSTVLPAVAGVREWLGNDRCWQEPFARMQPWPGAVTPASGVTLILAGVVGLVLLGARPQEAYAAVWVGPLSLALGLVLLSQPDQLAFLGAGDWRPAASWAFAALICGFFWELWNLHSFAKWIYTVPYVHRWPVFEMPLLGYSGYLPFGLACGLIATWAAGKQPSL